MSGSTTTHPMRILMINYEYPPIGGGTGNACHYMLKEFASYPNLHIDLVTFSPDNRTHTSIFSHGINIHYVACGKKQSLHHWKTSELVRWLIHTRRYLASHLCHASYDLIHCWSGWPAGMLGYHFRRHAPYIIALRGSDVPGHTPRTALLDAVILQRLSRIIWRNAAAVTAVSRYLAALASKTLQCEYHIINNGIDTTEFYPATSARPSHPIRLLYVGRINSHKGVDDLITALSILQSTAQNSLSDVLDLTIIGSGSLEHQIKASIQANGLTRSVTFTGIIPHSELPPIYRQHDVLVFPCHSDAMANVILEAIASGLAIISTNTGGAELINGNGLIINRNDPADLEQKLSQIITQPRLLSQFKHRSAELACTLGWDHCCAAYHKLYTSILSGAAS